MSWQKQMKKQMKDYPASEHDDQVDARLGDFRTTLRRQRVGRALLKTANWLLTLLFLTAVPYFVGYVGMRMIRFMVAPPTLTTQVEWVFAIWCLGLVTTAALAVAIGGAYVLVKTTREM